MCCLHSRGRIQDGLSDIASLCCNLSCGAVLEVLSRVKTRPDLLVAVEYCAGAIVLLISVIVAAQQGCRKSL